MFTGKLNNSDVLNYSKLLRENFLNVPDSVFDQVIAEHGRSEAFQSQYSTRKLPPETTTPNQFG